MKPVSVVLVLCALSAASVADAAEAVLPAPVALPPTRSTCDLIAEAAEKHALPVEFFTRLIWQESSFRPDAVSPAGARGIAQFMPATAAERGLADPLQQHEALLESAAFLAELRTTFGNLGLAAAAYNAGPGRVGRWLAGEIDALPLETVRYVVAVTGRSVESWKGAKDAAGPDSKRFSCLRYAALAARAPRTIAPALSAGSGKAWAVILVGNPQRDKAQSEYQIVKTHYAKILERWTPSVVHRHIGGSPIVRYIVQIEHDTRAGADGLCAQLRRAGGNCFVLANRS